MSHTEGPWEVVEELRENDEIVCDMLNCGYVIPSKGQALGLWRDDARLISAAPDLLAALENLAMQVKRHADFQGHTEGWMAFDDAMQAISKATGT